MILDCEFKYDFLLSLWIPFFSIGHALFNTEKRYIKFRGNSEKENFDICMHMHQSTEFQSSSSITYGVESSSELKITERFGVEVLETIIMNFESDLIDEYDELVVALVRCKCNLKPKKFVGYEES